MPIQYDGPTRKRFPAEATKHQKEMLLPGTKYWIGERISKTTTTANIRFPYTTIVCASRISSTHCPSIDHRIVPD